MVTILSIIAANKYNRGHGANGHQFPIRDINGIAAVHRDSNRPQPDPFVQFLSIHKQSS
jgi:hypothetical protein